MNEKIIHSLLFMMSVLSGLQCDSNAATVTLCSQLIVPPSPCWEDCFSSRLCPLAVSPLAHLGRNLEEKKDKESRRGHMHVGKKVVGGWMDG